MTLRYANTNDLVDDAQVHVIQNAGGAGLTGSFAYGPVSGWELTLRRLTLSELLRVIEAVKEVLR